ncbi:DUF6240 domain-containing protein [Acetatifactor aquisgranensis]|uniref:DUF6240 domain-containing protein n=1 Tax=Acetatifactor aquisgranensis TaxID=2941233 RepID=UPI00203C3682|nr:DUF6240 domain-containing protein [Acetatifactor aquisgranensis]
MKITFSEQAIKEAQRRQAEKNREAQQTSATSVGQTAFADMFGRHQDSIVDAGEKGKSLIELQQEAGNVDVGVQRDFMTVMSHTMSEEDYAKMQEEGFDLGSMDPEEVVTIVDKIKAELVRAGKSIAGYTDDMDVSKLTAALGSEVLARSVVDSFREADVPLTKENLSAISRAWAMNSELAPLGEGSYDYLIDNEMEAEIWNLYLAQSSGAGKGTDAPRFYAEDVQGYYTQSAGRGQSSGLQGQIDRIIEQAVGQVNEKSRMNAAWLLDKGLPLTADNLKRLEALQDIELPMTEEKFAKAAAAAVAEGKDPVHASFSENSGNLYERAAAISDFYHSSELWEATVGDITARRQLEEVRLRMSAEVNVRLLRSGFSIDTEPMVELIEALKRAEYQLANQYFPRDNMAVEKYQNYQKASNVAGQLPGLPADVLGMFAKGEGSASLETIYNEGKAMQASYEKAQASYEKLMTAPRGDLGDSIDKAFASVDHILKDLGVELTDENRRAVRILGYNQMEVNLSNLDAVREADRQVQGVLEKLTPAATLKMIRDGFNPLEKSFGELEQYFKTLPAEYKKEADSYSRFLYGLERNNEITPEERESYIGIYRLVRQLEKAEGAAVGALVNSQTEIHFSNLLSALQSSRNRPLDMRVSDETGERLKVLRKGESISAQISKAFNKTVREIREANAAAASIEEVRFEAEVKAAKETGAKEEQQTPDAGASAARMAASPQPAVPEAAPKAAETADSAEAVSEALVKAANDVLTEASSNADAAKEYNKTQLEEQRQAVSSADKDSVAMLQRGALPSNADNLMAAQALNHGVDNLFEITDRKPAKKKEQYSMNDLMAMLASKSGAEKAQPEPAPAAEETGSAGLWQKLDNKEEFVENYGQTTAAALESVEEATFAEADSSVDVRNMQLNHKQLTVAAALAKREEYYLPVYVGDTLTRVHLTLDKGSQEKGTVTVGVTLSEEAHLQARLYLENGMVHGMIFGEGKVELMKLRQIADTFKEEAQASWTVGNLTTITSETRMPELIKSGEHTPTDSAELYRVAKVFLHAIVQTP